MSAAVRFKQADITRAVKGAKAAGLRVTRFEIDPLGKIVVFSDPVQPQRSGGSLWDQDL